MKTGLVIKSKDSCVTQQELSLINQYTRKELTADDVYVFSVVLCDNEIDRDYERFTVEALFELEKLFVGKSGVFDHNASARNQTARIFDCKVEAAKNKKTSSGDEYFRLVGRAYMPVCDKNRDLIVSIDSGIIKEVSVGCAVKKTVCSVCSNDIYSPQCHHTKGISYNGQVCHGILCDVYDAYEFSFVAVPAQRQAGVIKAFKDNIKENSSMKDLLCNLKKSKEMSLNQSECEKLYEYITELEKQALDGEYYKEQLKKEVCRCMSVATPLMSTDTIKSIVSKMSVCELKNVLDAHKKHIDDEQMYVQLSDKNQSKNNKTATNQFTI